VPPKSFISSEEETVNSGSQIVSKKVDVKSPTKILLVGQDQSGTSAIYKQVRHCRTKRVRGTAYLSAYMLIRLTISR
jgi:lysine/ornithine N-monooxygenase